MILQVLGRAALVAACAGSAAGTGSVPRSSLSVRVDGAWREWWRSNAADSRLVVSAKTLANAIQWRRGATGIEWAEADLSGSGEAWRTKLIVARIDPRRVRLALDTAFAVDAAAWGIDRADSRAVLAVNAGQFVRTMPWGWVMLDGSRFLAPSVAPLVTTFTVARDGMARLTHASVPDSAGVRWAFQSYPTLLAAGVVPEPLRRTGCGVDLAHRDARLAIGVDAKGNLLIALTRFDALGGALDRVPFGLTTPEMAGTMAALGASDAVLLDGGISAQLMLRDSTGVAHHWPGTRRVPLGLVVYPK